MSFINKLIFGFYYRLSHIYSIFKVAYFKQLWKGQLHIGKNFKFDRTSNIDLQSGNASLIIDDCVYFRKYCNVICSDNGKLVIGKNVFFNNYCSINCLYKITIGYNTIFGEGVKMYDHNHQFNNKNKKIADQGLTFGEIKIGENCWIASNVTILKNITIGDNVVIGANCLIYKSIPSNTVVKNKTELISEPI